MVVDETLSSSLCFMFIESKAIVQLHCFPSLQYNQSTSVDFTVILNVRKHREESLYLCKYVIAAYLA